MIEFENIAYLKNGNLKQQKAFNLLTKYQIMEKLVDFNPILVGTIPIEIDIDSSDLDIICEWTNPDTFISFLHTNFSHFGNFKQWAKEINSHESVIANFIVEDFEIEIFGQNISPKQQFAYKHLIIEQKIIEKFGKKFKEEIINLKKQGFKTEPAFTKVLGIEGNPYLALLEFEI